MILGRNHLGGGNGHVSPGRYWRRVYDESRG